MPGPPKLYKLSRENQKLFHHKIVSINNQDSLKHEVFTELLRMDEVYSESNIIEGYDCDGEACDLFDELIHLVITPKPGLQTRRTDEMYLMSAIIHFYEETNENITIQQNSLSAIYNNTDDGPVMKYRERLPFLISLVSLSISMRSHRFLDHISFWILSEDINCPHITFICDRIIKDHVELVDDPCCHLYPIGVNSPEFAATYLNCIFRLKRRSNEDGQHRLGLISETLLSVFTRWISHDDKGSLLLASISDDELASSHDWTSPSKSNMQTSVPDLIRNLLGHTCISSDLEHVWVVLHRCLLDTLSKFSGYASRSRKELITLKDMQLMVKDIVELTQSSFVSKSVGDLCHGRLLQLIQVALTVGAFRCALS